MNEKFVFHGSPKKFDGEEAVPRRNIRANGERVIFDKESFHATKYKWIALAYMHKPVSIDGLENEFYSVGINLYSDEMEVAIFGIHSLEESLEKLYEEGGYLYEFNDGNFVSADGLGSEEVIATQSVKPVAVTKIENPVAEMQKLGVKFVFFDVSIKK